MSRLPALPFAGRPLARLALAFGLVVLVMLVVAACSPIEPSAAPGASIVPGSSAVAGATAAPTIAPSATVAPTPLIVSPAELKADPVSLIAWLFNPIFQLFLILLLGIHSFVGDMGVSIIITTLIVRTSRRPRRCTRSVGSARPAASSRCSRSC